MACLEREQIESLLAGELDEEQAGRALAHLRTCDSCRQEAAFTTAVRLALPQDTPGPACLTDEEMCLLRDNALPQADRRRALAHLAGCPRCMAGLIQLDRALDEAEARPLAPPAALVERAVALGTRHEGQAAPSWLQRLLTPSFLVRFGLAASAAAAVFLLTLLVTTPGTEPEEPAAASNRHAMAEAPAPARDLPAPAKTQPPAAPVADTSQPDQPGIPPAARPAAQPREPGGTETPGPRPWLAALKSPARARLLGRLSPVHQGTQTPLAHAFDHPGQPSSVGAGIRLGKTTGTLALFSAHMDTASSAHLSGLTRHLARWIPAAVPGDPAAGRLAGFAKALSDEMQQAGTAGPIARKVEVLEQALTELLAGHSELQLGYRLGQMSRRMEVAARAYELGVRPPRHAWPSSRVLGELKTRLEEIGKPGEARDAVLYDLETLAAETPPSGPTRAERILDTLNLLDRHLGELP